ncbi:MAG: chemotaxis protein CheX [Sedimentisphaerales bacterium]|nr:chemotaxis protein CheX [Sedimentisphaerales bacterium]
MQKVSEDVLVESLTEALETTAFMMAMLPDPQEELVTPSRGVLVHVEFSGPVSGTVELWAGDEFSQMMAANVMGLDPDDDAVKNNGVDAVKEMVNIISGVLLAKLADSPADVFNLTVPEAQQQPDAAAWQAYVAQDNVIVLDVDGFAVAARLITTE